MGQPRRVEQLSSGIPGLGQPVRIQTQHVAVLQLQLRHRRTPDLRHDPEPWARRLQHLALARRSPPDDRPGVRAGASEDAISRVGPDLSRQVLLVLATLNDVFSKHPVHPPDHLVGRGTGQRFEVRRDRRLRHQHHQPGLEPVVRNVPDRQPQLRRAFARQHVVEVPADLVSRKHPARELEVLVTRVGRQDRALDRRSDLELARHSGLLLQGDPRGRDVRDHLVEPAAQDPQLVARLDLHPRLEITLCDSLRRRGEQEDVARDPAGDEPRHQHARQQHRCREPDAQQDVGAALSRLRHRRRLDAAVEVVGGLAERFDMSPLGFEPARWIDAQLLFDRLDGRLAHRAGLAQGGSLLRRLVPPILLGRGERSHERSVRLLLRDARDKRAVGPRWKLAGAEDVRENRVLHACRFLLLQQRDQHRDRPQQLAVVRHLVEGGGRRDQRRRRSPVLVDLRRQVLLGILDRLAKLAKPREPLPRTAQVQREPGRQVRLVEAPEKLPQRPYRLVGAARLHLRRRSRLLQALALRFGLLRGQLSITPQGGIAPHRRGHPRSLELQLVDHHSHRRVERRQVLDRAKRSRLARVLLRPPNQRDRKQDRPEHRNPGEQQKLPTNGQTPLHIPHRRRIGQHTPCNPAAIVFPRDSSRLYAASLRSNASLRSPQERSSLHQR